MDAGRLDQGTAAVRENVLRFIGIREVENITGYGKSAIRLKVKSGDFPAPVIQEGNVTRWDYAEVLAWRDDLIRKRDERLKNARAAASEQQSVAAA